MVFNRKMTVLFVAIAIFIFQGCALFHGESQSVDSGLDSAASGERPGQVAEFILGYGDKLEVTVYRNADLTKTVRIGPSGNIDYPLVGVVRAAGLSIFELKANLSEGLKRYIKNPQVSIGVISTQSQKITVLGEVKRPGFFQLEGELTMLEAISGAGGFTNDGKSNSVLLIRGGLLKPELKTLNLREVLSKGDISQNVTLARGDIIYVPRTFISNVDRFFGHLTIILGPLLDLERGYFIGQKIELDNSGSDLTISVR